ncbi:MAG: hypothetical protein ACI9H8_002327 [Lysobacterales bacterium]
MGVHETLIVPDMSLRFVALSGFAFIQLLRDDEATIHTRETDKTMMGFPGFLIRSALSYSLVLIMLLPTVTLAATDAGSGGTSASYEDLLVLFKDWRDFEKPEFVNGAPNYTAPKMAGMHLELKTYQDRLNSIEIKQWPIDQQVDWHLMRAEMNGMDFNIRVLKPWQRDPAYYTSVWSFQSDTPAHEGGTHHAVIELWQYSFPLSTEQEEKLAGELGSIQPLLEQARQNLTGNARDLWVAGIKNIDDQTAELESLAEKTNKAGSEFKAALMQATEASRSFSAWLEQQSPSRNGPSGVGKDNYTWYLRNVHLVPLSWEEEVTLLKRELDRAHARLRLEEHHNRHLPPIVPISSPEEFAQRAELAIRKFTDFLKDEEILPPYDYIEPALRAQMGEYVPPQTRNFFATAAHHDLLTLWTHWYHWFDLAHIASEPHPSPIRRGPLLYNIWGDRAEGMATGFEEMMMHAGLFDDNPRAREVVYIMLAQRAARGLGSLYAQANIFTMQEARNFHVEWTPRGWMREDLDLLGFEQHLYLRQPGYGTSYVTGKYLIERLVAERGKQLKEDFSLLRFFTELDQVGVIPVSMIRWQLTGKDDEVRDLMSGQ